MVSSHGFSERPESPEDVINADVISLKLFATFAKSSFNAGSNLLAVISGIIAVSVGIEHR